MTMIVGMVRRFWSRLPRLQPRDPLVSRAIGLM